MQFTSKFHHNSLQNLKDQYSTSYGKRKQQAKPGQLKQSCKIKTTSGGIAITDFKLYCRAVVIKTSKNWHKNKQIDQQNQIKDSEVNLYTQGHTILDKEAGNKQWKKESFFNKLC